MLPQRCQERSDVHSSCTWFGCGKMSALCLYYRCSSIGRDSPMRFQGLDKVLLREPERLTKELSSAGSHWIPLSHILCLKWGLQSLLWCLIPIHLHAFFLQLQSSKKNSLINSTSVTKSTDAWEKFLIKMLGTAQFCLCLLGLGRWTKHRLSCCKNLWLAAPKALVMFLQPSLC